MFTYDFPDADAGYTVCFYNGINSIINKRVLVSYKNNDRKVGYYQYSNNNRVIDLTNPVDIREIGRSVGYLHAYLLNYLKSIPTPIKDNYHSYEILIKDEKTKEEIVYNLEIENNSTSILDITFRLSNIEKDRLYLFHFYGKLGVNQSHIKDLADILNQFM